MLDERILSASVPATFALIALALAMIARLDRRSMAARWGSAAFLLAAVGVGLDAVRPPGQNWALFYLHIAVAAAFGQAMASRMGQTLPRHFTALLLATAIGCGFLTIGQAPFGLRQVVFNLGLFGAFAALARASWVWAHRTKGDKAVVAALVVLSASYLFRAHVFLAAPASAQLVDAPATFDVSASLTSYVVAIASGLATGGLVIGLLWNDARRGLAMARSKDALTGIGSAHAITLAADAERSNGWQCGAAILLDFDHLRSINSVFGRKMGDGLLAGTARTLEHTIGWNGRLIRLSGGEFLLLVDAAHCGRIDEIAELAREVIGCIRLGPVNLPIQPTASFGYALRGPDEKLGALIDRAREAVAIAKTMGRDCVVSFDDIDRDNVERAVA